MKYRYSGPNSGVTLRNGNKSTEVMLITGAEVELPAQHEYVQVLLKRGHLTPAPDPAATTPAATAPAVASGRTNSKEK